MLFAFVRNFQSRVCSLNVRPSIFWSREWQITKQVWASGDHHRLSICWTKVIGWRFCLSSGDSSWEMRSIMRKSSWYNTISFHFGARGDTTFIRQCMVPLSLSRWGLDLSYSTFCSNCGRVMKEAPSLDPKDHLKEEYPSCSSLLVETLQNRRFSSSLVQHQQKYPFL